MSRLTDQLVIHNECREVFWIQWDRRLPRGGSNTVHEIIVGAENADARMIELVDGEQCVYASAILREIIEVREFAPVPAGILD